MLNWPWGVVGSEEVRGSDGAPISISGVIVGAAAVIALGFLAGIFNGARCMTEHKVTACEMRWVPKEPTP